MAVPALEETIYDVIIVGGGPAGLAAAIYTARHKQRTLVLEGNRLGGRAMDAHMVENFPGFPGGLSGEELLERVIRHAKKFGAEFRNETVIGVSDAGGMKVVSTRQGFHEGLAVILATGINRKQLNIPGEMEYKGRGVSYCAVCDGPFFSGGKVAVIGSGKEALEDARLLAETSAKVYAIPGPRGYSEDLGLKFLENPKIEVLRDHRVQRIEGDDFVTHLILLGADRERLDVDGVFVILEHVSTKRIVEKTGINVDDGGCIMVDRRQETNIPGIYAAGDCTCVGMQIATAIGDGVRAALSAIRYVERIKKRKIDSEVL